MFLVVSSSATHFETMPDEQKDLRSSAVEGSFLPVSAGAASSSLLSCFSIKSTTDLVRGLNSVYSQTLTVFSQSVRAFVPVSPSCLQWGFSSVCPQ